MSSTEPTLDLSEALIWHRRTVGVIWVATLTVLVVFAAHQQHPSAAEPMVASTIVAVAVLASWLIAPGPASRTLRWVVPLTIVVTAVSVWNPWNLVAVDLVGAHPFLAAAGLAALAAKAVWPSERDGQHGARGGLTFVLISTAGFSLVLGALVGLVHLGFGRSEFSSSTEAGSTRIDEHGAAECHDGTVSVLRSGSGLSLREGPSSVVCGPETWSLVNEHLVVVTCTQYRPEPLVLVRYFAVDSNDLKIQADTTVDANGCRS